MKISRKNALALWEEECGSSECTDDFDGGYKYKHSYGDSNYSIVRNGSRIYCGWNLHHILLKAWGGEDSADKLICTNIITNERATDKVTYWTDDKLYQARKIKGTHSYLKIN